MLNSADFLSLLGNENNNLLESDYVNLENINQYFNCVNDSLKVLHLNICGLCSKIDKLVLLLQLLANNGLTIDIITVCETFINDKNKTLCEIDGYNFEYEYRKNKTKGGVGIYVSQELKYICRKEISFFIEGKIESCFIEIKRNKGNGIVVGEVYRVPGTDDKLLYEAYSKLFLAIEKEKKDIIIGTDQNLDFLKINSHYGTNLLYELITSYGIIPSITKPTRITHSSATVIDNIYISGKLMTNYRAAVLEYDISDHLPCICLIENSSIIYKANNTCTYRDLRDKNVENFRQELKKIDITLILDLDCENAYKKFQYHVKRALDKSCPVKTIKIKKKQINQPWMTRGLLKSSYTCNKLYRKTVGKANNDRSFDIYKKYRNIYNRTKSQNKANYYKEKINESKNNCKKIWKIYNSLIGKLNNKKDTISSISKENIKIHNGKLIANEFSEFFASVGKAYSNKIKKSRKSYNEYMSSSNLNSLYFIPTCKNEIESIVKTFKNKTSSGIDEISNKLLKLIIRDISTHLEIIFNKSLSEGKVPSDLKKAIIVPIYKGKEKTNINNYRPVSLLTAISKILEKIIYKRLYVFLETNNILYDSQYGFRPKRNTVDAITEMIGNVLKSLDNKKFNALILLDLSKAFDTIDHKILSHKLYKYGIRGVCLDWFNDYLNNRMHCVKIQKDNLTIYSDFSIINTGVPQGSVLGPLLYLIYINDFNNALEIMKSISFADDTNLILSRHDIDELYIETQYDLENALDWFRANKLSVNVEKTCYMIIRPRNNEIPILNTLTLDSKKLREVQSAKFLGLNINNKLSWTEQVYYIINKLNTCEYLLKRTKFLLPESSLKTIYCAYAQSHLTYGIQIWGCMLNNTQKKLLNRAQDKCILQVKKIQNYRNVDKIYCNLKLLKIDALIELELLKLAYKLINKTIPINITELFSVDPPHRYPTRNRGIPRVLKHRTSIMNKSFLTKINQVWNKCSNDVKSAKSIKNVISQFCNKYYASLNIN